MTSAIRLMTQAVTYGPGCDGRCGGRCDDRNVTRDVSPHEGEPDAFTGPHETVGVVVAVGHPHVADLGALGEQR